VVEVQSVGQRGTAAAIGTTSVYQTQPGAVRGGPQWGTRVGARVRTTVSVAQKVGHKAAMNNNRKRRRTTVSNVSQRLRHCLISIGPS
jgi:hypothetical protein